jgi:hypothetical protein
VTGSEMFRQHVTSRPIAPLRELDIDDGQMPYNRDIYALLVMLEIMKLAHVGTRHSIFELLPTYTKLHTLSIMWIPVQADSKLSYLQQCVHLTSLTLGWGYNSSSSCFPSLSHFFPSLSPLRVFSLSRHSDVTSAEVLRILDETPTLRYCALDLCVSITEECCDNIQSVLRTRRGHTQCPQCPSNFQPLDEWHHYRSVHHQT